MNPELWTWWFHKKTGLRMQVTQNIHGASKNIHLLNKSGAMKWEGNASQFIRNFSKKEIQ